MIPVISLTLKHCELISDFVTCVRTALRAFGLWNEQWWGEIQVTLLRQLVRGDWRSGVFRHLFAHLHTTDFVQDVERVTGACRQTEAIKNTNK